MYKKRFCFNAYSRVQTSIDVSLQGIASADADFGIKGEANMDLQILLDKRNNILPMQFIFNGLDVKIWVKLNAKIEDEINTRSRRYL